MDVQAKGLVWPVPLSIRDDLTSQQKLIPKWVKECKWKPMGIKYVKEIKQSVVSYGMLSPFVREMLNMCFKQ